MDNPGNLEQVSSPLYEALLANTLQGLFIVDSKFRLLDFNEITHKQLSKFREKEIQKGESFFNFVHSENLEATKADLLKTLKGEVVTGTRSVVRASDGLLITTKFCYTPVVKKSGDIDFIVLAYQDITQENLAIKRADHFSSMLDLLFKQNHEGLLVVDLNTLEFRANPEFIKIFDLSETDLEEQVKLLNNPGKWDANFPFSVKHAFSIPLKKDTDLQVLKNSAQPTYIRLFRNELEQEDGSKLLLLSVIDESERIQIEKGRIEHEINFKTVAKNFPNGNITIIDKNLNVVFSDGAEYETDLGEFKPKTGKSILDQYGPNYREYLKESLSNAFEGASEQFELTFHKKTYSMIVTPMPDPSHKINLVMKIAQNISTQKNAQLDAYYQKEYLRQIIDVDPNLIYVKDSEGKVLMANKAIASFFGATVQEFIEKSEEYFKTYKWRYEEILKLDEQIFRTLTTKTTEEAIFNKVTKKMHLFQITRTPFTGDQNKLSILCVGVDITDRVNAENELITQREYLRHILDTDPNLIFVKDTSGKFLLVNKAFADYYQTTVEALIGKKDKELSWPEKDWILFESWDKEVINSNEQMINQMRFVNPITGTESFFVTTKKPLLDADGKINILGVVTDITRQKSQEEKIKKSEEMLQEIFNRVADALLILDSNNLKVLDCNQKAIDLLDTNTKEQTIGKPIQTFKVKSDLRNQFWTSFFKEIKSSDQIAEIEILKPNNVNIWGSLAATIFNRDGKDLILLRIADITLQKNSEEQIMQALNEKEILIQEIHHRVKNNMAVISSLLQLQTGYIKDPALIDVFKDSQSRIKSMALIHEKLYQSKTLAKVEMESYIKELARTLLFTYNPKRSDIKINTFVENVFLDINSAVPCGLLINEIISNACKHAFIGRDSGLIEIHFSKEEEQYRLEMTDNGIGMPMNTNFSDFKSLGMNLVQALASQLGAHLEIKTNDGLGYYLTFVEKVKPSRTDLTR